MTVDVDGNYIVNGSQTVPVPARSGYVFAGWLVEPNTLADGKTIKAYWRNQNNTMPPEQEVKWYSNRTATGTTKEVTVTFDANGRALSVPEAVISILRIMSCTDVWAMLT